MFLLLFQLAGDTGGFWSSLNNVHIFHFYAIHPLQKKLISYKFASNISKCCIFIVTSLLWLEEKLCVQVHVWSFLFQSFSEVCLWKKPCVR